MHKPTNKVKKTVEYGILNIGIIIIITIVIIIMKETLV
jgi:hypothetical protein